MKKQVSNSLISLEDSIVEERENLRDFLIEAMNDDVLDYIRINSPPGIGKSYAAAELPKLFPEHKYIYIVPSHKVAESVKIELKKHGIKNPEHVKGKKHHIIAQEFDPTTGEMYEVPVKLCNKRDGEEYYPGCSNCAHNIPKSCEWHRQFARAERNNVVVTTLHNIDRLGEGRVLIYDESFDTQMMGTSRGFNADDHIELFENEPVVLNKKVYTFYNRVKLKDDFEIVDENTYMISNFFNTYTHIHAYDFNSLTLYGRRKPIHPELYEKIIFACATTPNELMYNITNTTPALWNIYEPLHFTSNDLFNPMLKFNTKKNTYWSKNYAENNIKYVFGFLRTWFSGKRLEVLVITKLDFVKKIKKLLPHADYVNYGNGRAFNDYNQAYDVVIVYGNYGMTDLNFKMLDTLGFPESIVRAMERSEKLQCIHRCRPITHPETPFLLMTDHSLFPNIEQVTFRAFQDFTQKGYGPIIEGMSLSQIEKRIRPDSLSKKVNRAKDMMFVRRFMNKIIFRL